MKFQSRKFTCGPAALANALEVHGDYREEEALAKLCGTSVDGTTGRGLARGVKLAGYVAETLRYRDSTRARLALRRRIADGAPCLLCVDDWSHWITIIGTMGDRLIAADSASKHLIIYLTTRNLMRRWRYVGDKFEGYCVRRGD